MSTHALIYGLGRSGRAVARFICRSASGWTAQWYDQNPSPEDLALVAELGLTSGNLTAAYPYVIAAPGVPLEHPDLQLLAQNGAKIIGELELGSLTRNTATIGITGTAGKSGTTSLTAQLLRALGVNAQECGNFDPPFLAVIDTVAVAVIELSSFQLERSYSFSPSIAVMTNLGVDHIDRHGSIEAYHAAKRRITQNQKPHDTLVLLEGLEVPTQAQVLHFPAQPQHIMDSHGRVLVNRADIPLGVHPANLQAAVYAADRFLEQDLTLDEWREAIASLTPVAGRFQTIGHVGNVAFIEDSIATRTLAVRSALEQAPEPIAWVIGGVDKGAETVPLADVVEQRVSHIIAIGQDGPRLASDFNKPTTIIAAQNGDLAMLEACRAALAALAETGGSVLLAPMCTSFDQFKDYKDRARAFKAAFTQLSHTTPPEVDQ